MGHIDSGLKEEFLHLFNEGTSSDHEIFNGVGDRKFFEDGDSMGNTITWDNDGTWCVSSEPDLHIDDSSSATPILKLLNFFRTWSRMIESDLRVD